MNACALRCTVKVWVHIMHVNFNFPFKFRPKSQPAHYISAYYNRIFTVLGFYLMNQVSDVIHQRVASLHLVTSRRGECTRLLWLLDRQSVHYELVQMEVVLGRHMPPQKCPSHGQSVYFIPYPKWANDWFGHLCTAHSCAQGSHTLVI